MDNSSKKHQMSNASRSSNKIRSRKKSQLRQKMMNRKLDRLAPENNTKWFSPWSSVIKKLQRMIKLTDHFHKRADERVLEKKIRQIILGICRGNVYVKTSNNDSYYVLHNNTTYVLSLQLVLITAYPWWHKENMRLLGTNRFLVAVWLLR